MKAWMTILMCLVSSACLAQEATTDEENAILAQVLLQLSGTNGYYNVVRPIAHLPLNNCADTNEVAGAKHSLLHSMCDESNATVVALVDQLFQKNTEAAKITLVSAPDKGYVVDTDGQYSKYFEKDGGGWGRLKQEHPMSSIQIDFSRPAIDRASGLVLVYVGKVGAVLAGSVVLDVVGVGDVMLYEYKDGKLKMIRNGSFWNT